MIPEKDNYELCTFLDKCLIQLDNDLSSGKIDSKMVQTQLNLIKGQLENIAREAKVLNLQNRDSKNLKGRVDRVMQNLENIEGLAKILTESSQVTQKQPLIVMQEAQKPLNTTELLFLLHPHAGKKSEGGKEIQKVTPFPQWLDQEYSNKQSPTYKAYQVLSQSLNLNNAFLIGIRGDGNCGFRAMIASLLLQLASDPQCKNKFNAFIKRLDEAIADTKAAIPGFEKLNQKCLQDLKNCNGDPAKLANLLNQDDFLNQLTRIFRFLSNAICIRDKDSLPEEVLIQLEYGEGAQELGGLEPFLKRHATVDVENTNNVPGYLFAGVAQILVLARKLGLGYIISIVDEGQSRPQEPNISIPDQALLVLNLLCRDTRHFDVILQKR